MAWPTAALKIIEFPPPRTLHPGTVQVKRVRRALLYATLPKQIASGCGRARGSEIPRAHFDRCAPLIVEHAGPNEAPTRRRMPPHRLQNCSTPLAPATVLRLMPTLGVAKLVLRLQSATSGPLRTDSPPSRVRVLALNRRCPTQASPILLRVLSPKRCSLLGGGQGVTRLTVSLALAGGGCNPVWRETLAAAS